MPRSKSSLTLAACGLLAASGLQTAHARQAIPVEAVYGQPEFGSNVVVSPDGRFVAYELQRKPDDKDPAATTSTSRFMPDGTPRGIVGTRLQLLDAASGRTTAPCEHAGWTWAPSWSPDGQQLALYANTRNAVRLWVYDVATGACREFADRAVKARHWIGAEAEWTPDGRALLVPLRPRSETIPGDAAPSAPVDLSKTAEVYAFRSKRAAIGQAQDTQAHTPDGLTHHFRFENNSDLALADLSTMQFKTLVAYDHPSRPSTGRISPSGRWVSYLSTLYRASDKATSSHDLMVMPLQGGEPQAVFKAQQMPERDYYRLSYQWHPSQDVLIYLEQGQLWVRSFDDRGASAPRQLGAELGALAEWPLAFTPDGRHVVVGVDPDTKTALDPPPTGVAIVPLDGSPAWKPEFDRNRLDFVRLAEATPRFAWQPDGQAILLQLTERSSGRSLIQRFDLATRRSTTPYQGEPLRLRGLAVSPADHRKAYIAYESFSTPLDLYALQPNLRLGKRATHLTPALDGAAIGSLHTFETRVPQFDGSMKAVKTSVILPEGAKRGDALPAVVFFYPGSDISARAAGSFGGGSTIGVPISLFTSRGYAAVLVSALTGPGGQAGNVFSEIIDSMMPQVYRAADLGYVDIERLGLTGQSFGGFSTAAILSRTQLFRAGVATNGVYNLTGPFYAGFIAKDNSTAGGILWVENSQPRIGTHVWADMRRVIDNSPFHQADRIQTPLLLVQGMSDKGYPDAQMLFTALDRLDRNVEAAFYAQSEHYIGTWPKANAIDAATRILGFFERHIGAP